MDVLKSEVVDIEKCYTFRKMLSISHQLDAKELEVRHQTGCLQHSGKSFQSSHESISLVHGK